MRGGVGGGVGVGGGGTDTDAQRGYLELVLY